MFFKNSFISVKNKLSYTTGIIVALALFIVTFIQVEKILL